MDNRLAVNKQLPNQKNRAIGIAILVGFTLVCLTGNGFLADLTDRFAPGDTIAFLMWIIVGFIFSQGALLTLWLSLSSDKLGRRSMIFVAGVIAAFASWLLGFLLSLDLHSSFRQQIDPVLFQLGILPVFLFGFSIPFLGIRFFLGRQLVRQESLKPEKNSTRPRFTIASLMILTTVVALVGGSVELTRFGLDSAAESRWYVSGICLAVSSGCSLLGIVPMVTGLFRETRLRIWSVVILFWSLAISVATTAIFHAMNAGRIPIRWNDESTAMGLIALFFLIGSMIGLIGIRLVGFRLVKI